MGVGAATGGESEVPTAVPPLRIVLVEADMTELATAVPLI